MRVWEERGIVFFIQHYSIYDGPGFRTTVFMKGCPLRCRWCQNPESWNRNSELMVNDEKCILCGECAQVCGLKAIDIDEGKGRIIDREKCDLCFACVAVCPTGALKKVGRSVTVSELMAEIEKDEIFYYRSGGGVTISGGEPLYQPRFVGGLAEACKEIGYHTALDTSGFSSWSELSRVLRFVDLVLYDVKHMDEKAHKQGTGRSNKVVLNNLQRLSDYAASKEIWFRIPLVPGYNDSDENLKRTGQLARKTGAKKISILPFNRAGLSKYDRIGKRCDVEGVDLPSRMDLERAQSILEDSGISVTIGY